MTENNAEAREQILGHIHGIFQAFLKQDRDTIKKAHTDDWIGFLGSSTEIERGIDAYMAKTELSLKSFKGTDYEILDTEIQIYDNIAVVYYVARYDYLDEDSKQHSMPLRSVDIYRYETDRWIQAGSHITPIPVSDDGEW